MADTHADADFAARNKDLMEALGIKAQKMTELAMNRITAGAPGEPVLHEEQVGMFLVRKLPDDPDCLRISIGEPNISGPGAYVVIRGRTSDAIATIERALAALKVSAIEASGD